MLYLESRFSISYVWFHHHKIIVECIKFDSESNDTDFKFHQFELLEYWVFIFMAHQIKIDSLEFL